MSDIKFRPGLFTIPEDRIFHESTKLIFENVLIVRCEHNYMRREFDYHGFSPLFEKSNGPQMPQHTFLFLKEMMLDK
jgi:hypothetical protein